MFDSCEGLPELPTKKLETTPDSSKASFPGASSELQNRMKIRVICGKIRHMRTRTLTTLALLVCLSINVTAQNGASSLALVQAQ